MQKCTIIVYYIQACEIVLCVLEQMLAPEKTSSLFCGVPPIIPSTLVHCKSNYVGIGVFICDLSYLVIAVKLNK